MVFSTQADGWNLGTLYAKTEGLSPCLLLLRTLTHGSVVGVYITSAISPPSGAIRGDGNSFVCRLDGPEAACYRWVGRTADNSDSSTDELVKSNNFTRSQFGLFLDSCIMIGGSQVKGENALYLSSDLAYCVFGSSDTFGNTQLAPHDPNGAAIVADLEVLCGAKSYNQAQSTGVLDVKRRMWTMDSLATGRGGRVRGDSDQEGLTNYCINKKSSHTINPIMSSPENTKTVPYSGIDYTALTDNEV